MNKVVLAYSGGLDTSVAVAWLREQFGVDVVTLTVDLGGGSLRSGVEGRAISAGASRAYVVDARERFVTDFVWPHLQANALYQGAYPLATALGRPLIAKQLVHLAHIDQLDQHIAGRHLSIPKRSRTSDHRNHHQTPSRDVTFVEAG